MLKYLRGHCTEIRHLSKLGHLGGWSTTQSPLSISLNLIIHSYYTLFTVTVGVSLPESDASPCPPFVPSPSLPPACLVDCSYVREPDIEVGLVCGGKTTGVPLHGVMSGEGSLSSAIADVHTLLSGAADLSGLPDNADLSTAAFIAPSGNASLPRDWCHMSYENVDKRQLDVYLLVSKDKKHADNLRFALR